MPSLHEQPSAQLMATWPAGSRERTGVRAGRVRSAHAQDVLVLQDLPWVPLDIGGCTLDLDGAESSLLSLFR